MLDIKFVRENPDIVKQNIKNKFHPFKSGPGCVYKELKANTVGE